MARDIDNILNGTDDEEKFFDTGGEEGGPDGIKDMGEAETGGDSGGSFSEAEGHDGAGGNKAQQEADAQRKAAEEAAAKAAEEARKSLEVLDENRVKVGEKTYITEAALREERNMRKELQGEIGGLRQNMQQLLAMKEHLEAFRKEQAERAKSEEQQSREARYEEDPIRAIREDIDEIRSGKYKAGEQEQPGDQGQGPQQQGEPSPEQVEQIREFGRTVASQVAEFKKEHADYDEALKFVTERRMRDYKVYGYTDEQAINQAINQEAMQLAFTAIQQKKNPGEMVYEMAKAWGWNGSAQQDTNQDAPQDGNQGGNNAEEELRRQAEGMRQSGLSGGDAGGVVKDIGEMSDDEFDAFWREMEKSAYGG